MDSRHDDREQQIASDEGELSRLEEEKDKLVAMPHHGFADASRRNRLEEQIHDLEDDILREREDRSRRS